METTKLIKPQVIARAFDVVNDGDELRPKEALQFFSGPRAKPFLAAMFKSRSAFVLDSSTPIGRQTNETLAGKLCEYFSQPLLKVGYLNAGTVLLAIESADVNAFRAGGLFFNPDIFEPTLTAGRMLGVEQWEVFRGKDFVLLQADGASIISMSLMTDTPDDLLGLCMDLPTQKFGSRSKVNFAAGSRYIHDMDERLERERQDMAQKRKGKIWSVNVVKYAKIYVEAVDADEAEQIAVEHLDDAYFLDSDPILSEYVPILETRKDINGAADIFGIDGEQWRADDYPFWPE